MSLPFQGSLPFTCLACVEQLPPFFPINKAASSIILSPDARWLAESLSLSVSPDIIGFRQPGWPQQGWAFLGLQHDMETREEERKRERRRDVPKHSLIEQNLITRPPRAERRPLSGAYTLPHMFARQALRRRLITDYIVHYTAYRQNRESTVSSTLTSPD